MSTTAGRNRAAFATASLPLAASATTSMSVLVGEQQPEAGADHRLIVGDEDARCSSRAALDREPRAQDEAAAVRAPGGHLAAVELDPLADADEAVAEPVAAGGPAPVVAHLDAARSPGP